MDSGVARKEIISLSSLETHSQSLKNVELKRIFIDSPRALKRFGALIQKQASRCGLHDRNVKGLRNMQEAKDKIIPQFGGSQSLVTELSFPACVCQDTDSAFHTRKMSVFIRPAQGSRQENCNHEFCCMGFTDILKHFFFSQCICSAMWQETKEIRPHQLCGEQMFCFFHLVN